MRRRPLAEETSPAVPTQDHCAERPGRRSSDLDIDRGGRITLETKLVLRVGDLAFLSNRWSLTGGTMPDGSPAELGATTAEVARRQPDGTWLYVIDNAWGDQAGP